MLIVLLKELSFIVVYLYLICWRVQIKFVNINYTTDDIDIYIFLSPKVLYLIGNTYYAFE